MAFHDGRCHEIMMRFEAMNEPSHIKVEVRDQRSGDWLWTHKAILFSQFVSASDYKVYCGLASYAGNQDQKSFPSIVTLATRLNMSRTTVINSLRMLEHLGIIMRERNKGFHNVYVLLEVKQVQPPKPVKESDSPHRRLVKYFHEECVKYRGVKPVWTGRETKRLKDVLALNILTEEQLEQLMTYFLGSYKFKKFSPVMSVFFSGGIFTGLQNAIKNDGEFWKELDAITKTTVVRTPIQHDKIAAMVAQLSKKMAMPSGYER